MNKMKYGNKVYIRGCSCDKCSAFNSRWIKFANAYELPIFVSRLDPHKLDSKYE